MRPEQLLKTLEGRRVSGHGVHCYCCGGDSAVLRQRWCKDELELFCDSCETWMGRRVTTAHLGIWLQRRHYKYPLYSWREVGDGVMDRCQILEAAHAE